MDDYVSKPIRDEELLAAIQRTGLLTLESTEETLGYRKNDTEQLIDLSTPIFPEDAVLARVGGNREVLQGLIKVFYQDCNALMSGMNRGIQANDAVAVRSAAHTIKGMVAFFEANAATELAAKLEQAGMREELSGTHQIFSALARELTAIEGALSKYAAAPFEGWHLGRGESCPHDVFSFADA
jgi:HPt (histidine-containing phosphotransfer) domain-containing protein